MELTSPEHLINKGFEEITGLGSLYALPIYIITLELIDEKITSRILLTATIINSTINFTLKQLINAPRPPGAEQFLTSSFPSGHAATAFMTAAVLGQRYPKLRTWLLIPATLIATSRIIIGAHYTHDIIAGAAIGYTIGTLVTIKMEKMIKNEKILTQHTQN